VLLKCGLLITLIIIIIIKTFIHTTGERVFKTQLECLPPQTTQNKTQIKTARATA
jgi:hypothetical protein